MHETLNMMLPLAVLLAAGVISTALLPRFGIPAIFGYFCAGVVVGPSVTGWVPMSDTVELLAEFGVIFLLFDIGLHFSLKQLWAAKKDFLTMGPLQWAGTTAVIAGALGLLGIAPVTSILPVAGALALSSTAVALQTLNDRGEQGTPMAHSATALLIFQDVVAVILLALISADTANSDSATSLTLALGKAALSIAAVAVIGRLLRPGFAWIVGAGLDEAFTAAALLVVVVTASLTGLAGLSLPLGAFLGGMLLSESEYCYMIKTELKPFRGLLLGLFFITVGMSLDASVVSAYLGITLAVAGALLLVKGVLVALAARLTGISAAVSLRLGFTLGQGSEFAFVILTAMAASGAIAPTLAAILTASVVITMALTPALAPLGDRLSARLAARLLDDDSAGDEASRHVLINGASDTELTVASALTAFGHRYLALDSDRKAVARARSLGFSAGVGNLNDAQLVESFAETPDVLIVGRTTHKDAQALIRRLKQRRPNLDIITRVADETDAVPLRGLGAVVCVAPKDPDNRTLAIETLRYLNVAEDDIQAWAQRFDDNPQWEKADKAHAV